MGQQEERLRRTVSGAHFPDLAVSAEGWRQGADRLREVQSVLQMATEDVRAGFGESSEVSEASVTAFTKVAEKAAKRSEQMRAAAQAIETSNSALMAAAHEQRLLDASAPTQPQPPERTPGMPETPDTLRAEQRYGRDLGAYNAAMADRETRAKQRADQVDTTYAESAEVMRRIHGEPDERVMRDAAGSGAGVGGGRGAGGAAPTGGSVAAGHPGGSAHVHPTGTQQAPTGHTLDTGGSDPGDTTSGDVGSTDPAAPDSGDNPFTQPADPGSTSGTTSGTGGTGGLTAGIGGGIAGSAVMGGAALLGGRLAGGASVAPVGGASAGLRPIISVGPPSSAA